MINDVYASVKALACGPVVIKSCEMNKASDT